MTSKRLYVPAVMIPAHKDTSRRQDLFRLGKACYNPLGTNYGRFDEENKPAIPDKPDRHIPYSERKKRETARVINGKNNNPHGNNQHTKNSVVVALPAETVKAFREYLRRNRITLEQAADMSGVGRHFFGNMFYSRQKMFSAELLAKVQKVFPDFIFLP